MIPVLAAVAGLVGGLLAHDLAWQALRELPLRPLTGTCPSCGYRRGWTTLRCPSCHRPIGGEVLAASAGAGMGLAFGLAIGESWVLLAYLGMLILTLALAETDLHSLRIVDRLNLPGTLVVVTLLGVAAMVEGQGEAMIRALGGGVAYFAGSHLVYLATRGAGFGYGDVKLSFQLGAFAAFWSWGTLGWAVLLTALAGGAVSLAVLAVGLARRGRDREGGGVRGVMRAELPYGPVMILGAWAAIVLAGLGAFPLPT